MRCPCFHLFIFSISKKMSASKSYGNWLMTKLCILHVRNNISPNIAIYIYKKKSTEMCQFIRIANIVFKRIQCSVKMFICKLYTVTRNSNLHKVWNFEISKFSFRIPNRNVHSLEYLHIVHDALLFESHSNELRRERAKSF